MHNVNSSCSHKHTKSAKTGCRVSVSVSVICAMSNSKVLESGNLSRVKEKVHCNVIIEREIEKKSFSAHSCPVQTSSASMSCSTFGAERASALTTSQKQQKAVNI